MYILKRPPATRFHALVCCFGMSLATLGSASAANDPTTSSGVADSKYAQALQALPPKPLSERIPVTIYEFRSAAEGVDATAATDMFTTALIKSRQFRVVERERLSQGVVAEKQLNGAGQATGNAAEKQLRGARYIFEGTVSEANPSQDATEGGVNVGGFNLGHGKNQDVIAIDVRIVDANTGDVLDAVDIRQAINNTSSGVSGTAALANTIASLSGRAASPLTPDVNYQTSHTQGVDATLRNCIDAAVLELVKRVELTSDSDATH